MLFTAPIHSCRYNRIGCKQSSNDMFEVYILAKRLKIPLRSTTEFGCKQHLYDDKNKMYQFLFDFFTTILC